MEPRNPKLLSSLRSPEVKQNLALFAISIYLSMVLDKISNVIQLDILVYQFFEKNRIEVITQIILWVTHLGGTFGFVTFLILLTAYFLKQQKQNNFWKPFIIIIGIKLFTLWLKILIARPRPEHGILQLTTYSMPSGHAVNAGLMGSVLIILIAQSRFSKKIKMLTTLLSFILMFAIGFSRIYLGVHYLSDVVAGLLCGVTGIILFKKNFKACK